MQNKVTVLGYPADVGGASTELWHTIRLWRAHDVEVTCIPTWKADPHWQRRLDGLGCRTDEQSPQNLSAPPGSIVVAFCNMPFLQFAWRLLGCRLAWVPCMDYLFDHEREHYGAHGPFDAYIFQSRYQRKKLLPQLVEYGVGPEQAHRIPGTFDWTEFPYSPQPHHNGDPFVVGRLSRADQRKYSPATWTIYGGIPNVRARVMGWNRIVEQRLGAPPEWAEVLEVGAERTLQFLRSLHALVMPGGEAVENWPRVVLEAMAVGVPVLIDQRGGPLEMIQHGQTGYLCGSDDDFTHYATLLADNDSLRIEIASRARSMLEEELADPDAIWARWEQLFTQLEAA